MVPIARRERDMRLRIVLGADARFYIGMMAWGDVTVTSREQST
jgi:hypothetical protein